MLIIKLLCYFSMYISLNSHTIQCLISKNNALVANNSTILAEKQLIEWDYRETSLSILENRDPNENVVKFIKHPNRFYSVTKSDGTTFLSVCMSKIPEDIQERFIHDLEESWNEKQRWHVRLFTKKEDFGETQINSLLQRYNFEFDQRISFS